MPLDKAHATVAERRTLPAYPTFCCIVGGVWATDPGGRIPSTPALAFGGWVTPVMGLVVFGIGVWLSAVLALGTLDHANRWHTGRLYALGLGALVGWMSFWSCVLLAAAIFGSATWGAWAWPAMIAWLSWASLVMLESRGERNA